MSVLGSKHGGFAPMFGSKATSGHQHFGQKNHGSGVHGSTRSVRNIPTSRGIGDTGGGSKAAGNTANPVGSGQRDGQVREYRLNTSSRGSKVEKRKRGGEA
jgi:hypothetical protein